MQNGNQENHVFYAAIVN